MKILIWIVNSSVGRKKHSKVLHLKVSSYIMMKQICIKRKNRGWNSITGYRNSIEMFIIYFLKVEKKQWLNVPAKSFQTRVHWQDWFKPWYHQHCMKKNMQDLSILVVNLNFFRKTSLAYSYLLRVSTLTLVHLHWSTVLMLFPDLS